MSSAPKPEKVWESAPKPEKLWKSAPKPEKVWGSPNSQKYYSIIIFQLKVMPMCGWESVRKCAKSWESMRICAKTWICLKSGLFCWWS